MDKKTCVITGASGGIGSQIVRKFLDHSFSIVMIDIDRKKMEEVIERNGFDPQRIEVLPLDITDEEAVAKQVAGIIERHSRIDVLVNAAGICGEYNATIEYAFANFRKVYEVNVFGTFLMMKSVLPYMVKRHAGSIVNFGSVSGMRGYSFEIGYGSSKWAVIGMSETVANEYGGEGVRCNCVSPGWVNTCMMEKTIENYRRLGVEDPENWITFGSIHRPAEPAEIADAVYYLSSEEASFINGVNLVIDGGMLVK